MKSGSFLEFFLERDCNNPRPYMGDGQKMVFRQCPTYGEVWARNLGEIRIKWSDLLLQDRIIVTLTALLERNRSTQILIHLDLAVITVSSMHIVLK